MNYRQVYELGKSRLEEADVAEAALDARILLEHVCGTSRNDLLVHGDREVAEAQIDQYIECISRRQSREPLQHITGVQDFMGLEFAVNEHVLIPRQDTEILVEEVMKDEFDGSRILDMCTGSGCILISLLHYSNWCKGVGVDISSAALAVSKENANKLLPEEKRPVFVESNLFEAVEGTFDIIVSNPPYIRTKVIENLMPEVKDYEPMQALDGYEDGLYFYRRIVEEAGEYLNKDGRLYFEIGHDQGAEVSELMKSAGYEQVRVVKDYAGLDRVVCGVLKNNVRKEELCLIS